VATRRGWPLRAGVGAFIAFIGVHGVGPDEEGEQRIRSGVFTLTQAFGNEANNGTRLPYFRAGPDDWWTRTPAPRTTTVT